ncbi:MAG: YdiU family protein [Burkholderiales bacterium]|nr:YdiU family protein [Burkholderiales bacterium]
MNLATPDLRAAPAWRSDGWVRALAGALPGLATVQAPQPLPAPHWVARNAALAAELGWSDWLDSDAALALLAGNRVLPEGPWATAYSGHQFGVWAGPLGDGRALLLGEAATPQGGLEVQLKGAGPTPYSRRGDGRAVLRSSIREYLCSEAMHGLGIPTTRALALVGSPLPVRRETVETAAVVVRIAPSFLRFGHFEHFAHTAEDTEALRHLADATIARYFPAAGDSAQPYAALLQAVALRTAALMAQWQAAGFCHGVMNTDNMSMLGLTLDYGPFGFLDAFDPGHICNHTDQGGRYAWSRQPQVAFWNLHALARALLPLIGDGDAALAAIEPYKAAFADAMLAAWRAKLGLRELDGQHEADRALGDDLLRLMAQDRCDFTITFRRLAQFGTAPGAARDTVRDLFIDRGAFDAWAARYAARLALEPGTDAERAQRMNRVNPKLVLRNHLAEAAIRRAAAGDFGEIERLRRALSQPFDEDAGTAADAAFPPDWAQHLEVSCSS